MRRLMRPKILIPLLATYLVIAGLVAGLWFPLFFGGLALMVLAIARAVSARRRQAWALGLAGVAMSTGGYLWTAHPELLRGGHDDPIVAIPASTPSESPVASKKATPSPKPTPKPTPTPTPTPSPSWTREAETNGNGGYVPKDTEADNRSEPTATSTAPRWTQPATAPSTRRPVHRQPVNPQPVDTQPANTRPAETETSSVAPDPVTRPPASQPAPPQESTGGAPPPQTTQPAPSVAPKPETTAARETSAAVQTPA
ncbi:hypothetical protein EDD41_1305 [Luteococcus japonicus]|uniref:Uncharacterized protein n=1 Tax=Luteococcus japonicus TaxID=33984 RepID=A0A3N1ZTE6_9ACTN|nr:hypothetical protein [Luteococcus japonicus]ROR54119.1 hypothetical protein EDD41_1305 [Luteococcus japonicus]